MGSGSRVVILAPEIQGGLCPPGALGAQKGGHRTVVKSLHIDHTPKSLPGNGLGDVFPRMSPLLMAGELYIASHKVYQIFRPL